jgi:TPR repeat protein
MKDTYEDGIAAYQRGDYELAMRLWRPLAEHGNAEAQCNLGFLYATGEGVSQNDAAAVSWYRNAAHQGHVDAQFNLAFMYASGRGTPQNVAAAAIWYRKAADQGHAAARFNLELICDSGLNSSPTHITTRYDNGGSPAVPLQPRVEPITRSGILAASSQACEGIEGNKR